MVADHQTMAVIHFQDHGDESAPISFAILEPNTQPKIFLQQDPSSLSLQLQHQKILILVPSHWVSLIWVSMPNLNASQIKQALPFALEEELVDEFSHCHVVPIAKADAKVQVAVIDKSKMQTIVDYFLKWGVQPDIILPFSLALPHFIETMVCHLHQNQLAIRFSGQEGLGLVVEPEQIYPIFQWLMQSHPEIKKGMIFQSQTSDLSLKNQLNQMSLPLEWQTTSEFDLWEQIANQLPAQMPTVNLLFGEFKKAEEKSQFFSKKNRGWLFSAVCVALSFMLPLVTYAMLSWRLHGIENQVMDLQHQLFPQSKAGLRQTRALFENELKKLQDQQGHDPCWQLMGSIAPPWQADFKLSELTCQHSALQIKAEFPSADQLNQFVNQLTQQGLSVHQSNTELSGSLVKVQMSVSGAGV